MNLQYCIIEGYNGANEKPLNPNESKFAQNGLSLGLFTLFLIYNTTIKLLVENMTFLRRRIFDTLCIM